MFSGSYYPNEILLFDRLLNKFHMDRNPIHKDAFLHSLIILQQKLIYFVIQIILKSAYIV
jgi:hypothetical protein